MNLSPSALFASGISQPGAHILSSSPSSSNPVDQQAGNPEIFSPAEDLQPKKGWFTWAVIQVKSWWTCPPSAQVQVYSQQLNQSMGFEACKLGLTGSYAGLEDSWIVAQVRSSIVDSSVNDSQKEQKLKNSIEIQEKEITFLNNSQKEQKLEDSDKIPGEAIVLSHQEIITASQDLVVPAQENIVEIKEEAGENLQKSHLPKLTPDELAEAILRKLGKERLPKGVNVQNREKNLQKRTKAIFEGAANLLAADPCEKKQKFELAGEACSADIPAGGEAYAILPFILGQGVFKRVKASVGVASGDLFARSTAPLQYNPKMHRVSLASLEKEIDIQNRFKGEREFLQVLHSYTYSKTIGSDTFEKRATIMEYCERDLEAFFNTLPADVTDYEETLKNVMADVLLGLVKMNRAGIVHRDIKPGNIMIQDSKDGPIGKIADFGLAEEMNPKVVLRAGTPLYMSPEALILGFYNEGNIQICERNIKNMNENLQKIARMRGRRKDPQYAEAKRIKFEQKKVENEKRLNDLKNIRSRDRALREAALLDPKNDVWSYGMMIYEMLYKKNFYQVFSNAQNPEALASDVSKLNDNSVNAACKGIGGEFKKKMQLVLKKALVFDRNKRLDAESLYQFYCETFELPNRLLDENKLLA